MVTIGGIDELSGDANAVAVLADAAFENGVDVQDLPDCLKIFITVLERERRRSRGDKDNTVGATANRYLHYRALLSGA